MNGYLGKTLIDISERKFNKEVEGKGYNLYSIFCKTCKICGMYDKGAQRLWTPIHTLEPYKHFFKGDLSYTEYAYKNIRIKK